MNTSSTLFIRADASSQIGTGHVMRCIALGQAWQDTVQSSGFGVQGSVVFICAEVPDALAERIQSEGFNLVRIDAEPGSPEDLKQALAAVSSFRSQVSSFPSWLALDGYHFNLVYQQGVRAARHKLLLIDDYNHLPQYECDILLNQNINALELNYNINPDARRLLGVRYTMLRREFTARGGTGFQGLEKTERIFPNIGKNVLVTLGGADPDNVTSKVIQALQLLDMPELHVKVIVGPANPHRASLEDAIQHSTTCPPKPLAKDGSNIQHSTTEKPVEGGKLDVEGVSHPTSHIPHLTAKYPLEAGIFLGVGAAFDIHAGNYKDSPEWVKNSGLQWLHRLCKEPRRLWRRYLWIVPGFLWLVALQLLGLKRYSLEEGG